VANALPRETIEGARERSASLVEGNVSHATARPNRALPDYEIEGDEVDSKEVVAFSGLRRSGSTKSLRLLQARRSFEATVLGL
jgi:hypothetical protein